MFLRLVTHRLYNWRTDSEKKQTDRWESTICSFIFFLLSHVYKYWLEQPFLSGLQVLLFSESAHYNRALCYFERRRSESFLISNWANLSIYFFNLEIQENTVLLALNGSFLHYEQLKHNLRHVYIEFMFHQDFWGYLVLPQPSHMSPSDHVLPMSPTCVFPEPPLSSHNSWTVCCRL